MKHQLAPRAYRAIEANSVPAAFNVPGHLWKRRNGVWYVLYGPRLKKQISTRTTDKAEAESFMHRFFMT